MISLMWNLKKNRYKNIYADRNRFTDFENKLVVTKGHSCGEGWIKGLELACQLYFNKTLKNVKR